MPVGLCWISPLVNLRACDFAINKEMMTIRIRKSKTDQLRQGDEVLIARTNSDICLVARFERYLNKVGMTTRDQRFIFRAILKTKHGERLRNDGQISYSCMRSLKKMAQLGFPAQDFSLHSLRAGGATAAANAKVPDCIFKRHGR